MNKPFKITQRGGEQSNHYYGKVKVAPRRWQRHKLYTDRLASERKLIELQREADQYDSGIRSRERDRLERPITELRDEYIARMKLQRRKPEHVRISEHMLDRLIELGGWKRFRDIDRESMELIISKLAAAGATASYQNKFITRAKAFVHEFLPDSSPDPLRKLHRINEKGAKRTRDRRAATSVQISSLLSNAEIPHYRKVAYALAAYNGLRRNEVGSLAWDRVHRPSEQAAAERRPRRHPVAPVRGRPPEAGDAGRP